MRTFLKRLTLFLFPLILFLIVAAGTFFYHDPFQILKSGGEFKVTEVSLNEDYVATETYIKSYKAYNSFLFGSSRAGCGFKLKDWGSYIPSVENAFSYCASNESLFGILGKMRLIDSLSNSFDQAIIVFDTDLTFKRLNDSKGHLFKKHPLISDDSKKNFTISSLKSYITSGFFIRYMDYTLFGKARPYMKGYLNFDYKPGEYRRFDLATYDQSIKTDSVSYYESKKDVFNIPISTKEHPGQIDERVIKMLKEMVDILEKNNTNYRIIISPLYAKPRMNRKDLEIINDVFGSENVFNFSGDLSITSLSGNYYEASHYRPHVGKIILDAIYKR